MARLIEFTNKRGEILRGIIDEADSDRSIIFLHGFERTTVEPKFKNFIDRMKGRATLFRLDFAGTGLSDGNFSTTTIEFMRDDLESAILVLSAQYPKIKRFDLVAHSLGAVVAVVYTREFSDKIGKIVALAPALNQKDLQRFWYVKSSLKNSNPEIAVTWENYADYLDENVFYEYCRQNREVAAHNLGSNLCQEVEGTDFQILLDEQIASKLLIIHSQNDEVVPIVSNNQLPPDIQMISLTDGKHDLEKPSVVQQYLKQAVDFLEG